jgi:hypothetical protein
MAGMLHKMCNEPGYGSIECSPTFDHCLSKVKVYHELIHEILSVIPRRTLDDVPATTCVMNNKCRFFNGLVVAIIGLRSKILIVRKKFMKYDLLPYKLMDDVVYSMKSWFYTLFKSEKDGLSRAKAHCNFIQSLTRMAIE